MAVDGRPLTGVVTASYRPAVALWTGAARLWHCLTSAAGCLPAQRQYQPCAQPRVLACLQTTTFCFCFRLKLTPCIRRFHDLTVAGGREVGILKGGLYTSPVSGRVNQPSYRNIITLNKFGGTTDRLGGFRDQRQHSHQQECLGACLLRLLWSHSWCWRYPGCTCFTNTTSTDGNNRSRTGGRSRNESWPTSITKLWVYNNYNLTRIEIHISEILYILELIFINLMSYN